jgi:hypothetical protein
LQGILQFYQVENINVKKSPNKEEIEKVCTEINGKS